MLTTFFLTCALSLSMQGMAEPQQTEGRIEVEIRETRALGYLIALPEAYDPEGEPVPLVLFLHGSGERGDDLDLVKKQGLPKMIAKGHDFGAVVVSPQCPKGSWWEDEMDLLIALLDKVENQYNVDKSRVYVTGLSMGGYGTFSLAAKHPKRFAAAVPICGGGRYFDARNLSRMPMWVFHGEDDKVVPVEESRRMVEIANRSLGENALLTTFPGVGHNSWDKAYNNKATWDWLFAQKLGD